jgi:non-haem dioxygenase in morphine synthesis N-terminal
MMDGTNFPNKYSSDLSFSTCSHRLVCLPSFQTTPLFDVGSLHQSQKRIVSDDQPFATPKGANICPVDWADLTVIDLAKAKTPEGRAEQVRLARDATHKQGFFYVINHGFDKATVGYRS